MNKELWKPFGSAVLFFLTWIGGMVISDYFGYKPFWYLPSLGKTTITTSSDEEALSDLDIETKLRFVLKDQFVVTSRYRSLNSQEQQLELAVPQSTIDKFTAFVSNNRNKNRFGYWEKRDGLQLAIYRIGNVAYGITSGNHLMITVTTYNEMGHVHEVMILQDNNRDGLVDWARIENRHEEDGRITFQNLTNDNQLEFQLLYKEVVRNMINDIRIREFQ